MGRSCVPAQEAVRLMRPGPESRTTLGGISQDIQSIMPFCSGKVESGSETANIHIGTQLYGSFSNCCFNRMNSLSSDVWFVHGCNGRKQVEGNYPIP